MEINNCQSVIEHAKCKPNHPMVLLSLKEAHVGMLIAAPDVGKSSLALSIAIEVASGKRIVGLSSQIGTPMKALYISSEDGMDEVSKRMDQYKNVLNGSELNNLFENLDFVFDPKPIVLANDSNQKEMLEHLKYVDDVIEKFKTYKLIIIDTVSEIIGDCDEVKHDRKIKNTISTIAKRSGAAILLVHHVNKNDIRGIDNLTMASGAGLSTLIRLVKCSLGLVKSKDGIQIHFLKRNYLPDEQAKSIKLIKLKNGMLIESAIAENMKLADVDHRKQQEAERLVTKASESQKTTRKTRASKVINEPEVIELGGGRGGGEDSSDRKGLRDVL